MNTLRNWLIGIISGAILTASSSAEPGERFTFVSKDGIEVTNALFSKRTPAGVSFQTEGGIRRFDFEKLPENLQRRFEYDATEAREYRQRLAALRADGREKARTKEMERRKTRDHKKALPDKDVTLRGIIRGVRDDGVLLHCLSVTRPETFVEQRQIKTDGPTTLSPNRPTTYRKILVDVKRPVALDVGPMVFLASKKYAATAVDGQTIEEVVYRIGRHQFKGEDGEIRTLARFAHDETTAITLLRKDAVDGSKSPPTAESSGGDP